MILYLLLFLASSTVLPSLAAPMFPPAHQSKSSHHLIIENAPAHSSNSPSRDFKQALEGIPTPPLLPFKKRKHTINYVSGYQGTTHFETGLSRGDHHSLSSNSFTDSSPSSHVPSAAVEVISPRPHRQQNSLPKETTDQSRPRTRKRLTPAQRLKANAAARILNHKRKSGQPIPKVGRPMVVIDPKDIPFLSIKERKLMDRRINQRNYIARKKLYGAEEPLEINQGNLKRQKLDLEKFSLEKQGVSRYTGFDLNELPPPESP